MPDKRKAKKPTPKKKASKPAAKKTPPPAEHVVAPVEVLAETAETSEPLPVTIVETPKQEKSKKRTYKQVALVGYALGAVTAVSQFIPTLLQYDTAPTWLKLGTVVIFAAAGALHYASEPKKPKCSDGSTS